MKGKNLVIVESPTKARTISRFLPSNFIVEASIGHIRDLPQTAADIPASRKGLEWARLGVDVKNGFSPLYVTLKGKGKIINSLKRRMKEVDALYLATDEDREGESISWHLVEVLGPEKHKIPVRRMVFHEITRSAITAALEHTRDIDMNLVRAQEARRIVDRLYGFTLSPLIWKKIAFGLSAGRVQSPGLRLIVERERKRIDFRKALYWDIQAKLSSPESGSSHSFDARLVAVAGKQLATGKDFNPATGNANNKDLLILTEKEVKALKKDLADKEWAISDVSEKEITSQPAVPFITSTLQQEGNRKLGLSTRETMRTAQRLYEEGLITYMRTDSPVLSKEAIAGARHTVELLYGKTYLSSSPRQFSSKNKNAQEAHEAIRPAGSQFTHPDETGLSGRERALYEIIWKRTLATQMANARKSSTTVKIQAGDALFQASGTKILFPGFLKLYVEGNDDNKKGDGEIILPDLQTGQKCTVHSLETSQHETRPPARYTEASLVQNLEKLGIGRPSTYSNIIGTLFDRNYVKKLGGALIPSYTGMAVVQFLENNFAYLIEYGFTSEMETSLDQIASGERDHLDYLKHFYSGRQGLKARVEHREDGIKPTESRKINLPQVSTDVELRVGRYGPYIIAEGPNGEKVHTSIPEEIAPSDLSSEDIQTLIEIQIKGPEPIGVDPESSKSVFCLNGRYGFYVQLGEVSEAEPKPKRASIPRGVNPQELTLDDALKYLSIPRILGAHPESGTDVTAAIGRFGPFVVHNGDFRSLKKDDDVYTLSLDRALELLNEKQQPRRRRSMLIRELGELNKKKIALYSGKYGPYIKHGTKNIPLPDEKKNDKDLEKLTLAEASAIVQGK